MRDFKFRPLNRMLFVVLNVTVLVSSIACTDTSIRTVGYSSTSPAQTAALQKSVFSPSSRVTAVSDQNDALIPNLLDNYAGPGIAYVSNCDASAYEKEKAEVMDIVRKDITHTTVALEYVISVGNKFDELAHDAHMRSALRKDRKLTYAVPVGPANSVDFDYSEGTHSFHYDIDITKPRDNFSHGTRCFFDTASVVGQGNGYLVNEDGIADHVWSMMFYGDVVDTSAGPSNYRSPRLFKRLHHFDYRNEDPQAIAFYVADIRNAAMGDGDPNLQFLNQAVVSSWVRQQEYMVGFRHMFNLPLVWQYRDQLAEILSTNRYLTSDTGQVVPLGYHPTPGQSVFSYSAYVGVPQLLHWIVTAGLSATVLSTQYTPLVINLSDSGLMTSSVTWGTYFNLANLFVDGKVSTIHHRTAWIGGDVALDVQPQSVSPEFFLRRGADGFLAVKNSNGLVQNAQDLFSSFTPVSVGGVTKTFSNGFDALAAFAGKDCSAAINSADDLKKRYVGPWDGNLYASKLVIWVDRNRNGVSEPEELGSLSDAGIGAVDACSYIDKQESDRFGNSVKLRSAVLRMAAGEKTIGNEAEILQRLSHGASSAGVTADFRVMVDVNFQTNQTDYLEDIDAARVTPAPALTGSRKNLLPLPGLH